MKLIDPTDITGLSKEDQEIARKIATGNLNADDYCYCERCDAIHLYTVWQGKRVMLGACGAFAQPLLSKPL